MLEQVFIAIPDGIIRRTHDNEGRRWYIMLYNEKYDEYHLMNRSPEGHRCMFHNNGGFENVKEGVLIHFKRLHNDDKIKDGDFIVFNDDIFQYHEEV